MPDKTVAEKLLFKDSINTYAGSIDLTGVAIISVDQDWSALRLKVQ
jgi:hypothetical protein